MDFSMRYDIRLANYDDVDDIMNFISKYWRENHVMSRDKKLFLYEFEYKGDINFIIAREKKDDSIQAIFGFLRCSASEKIENKDIWGSFWKVRDDIENMPFLGVKLAQYAKEITQSRMHIGNGANPKTTVPLRRVFFKEKCGIMKQYYLLNEKVKDYKVAKINSRVFGKYDMDQDDISFRPLNNIEEVMTFINIENLNSLPYKDQWYFNKRFYEHPYYNYNVVALTNTKTDERAIIVARELKIEGKKILRIVDYYGEQKMFANLACYFQTIVNNYEYIDFLVYGFDESSILAAGFVLNDGVNIIPNYFEPFTKSNVDVWVHYKYEGTTFFKADGDQDRPNIYRENLNE